MQLKFEKIFMLFLAIFILSLCLGLGLNALARRILRDESIAFIPAGRFSGPDGTLADVERLRPGDSLWEVATAVVPAEDLPAYRDGEIVLYVPGLNGEGYRVFFNGILLGSAGDHANGRANIWNASFIFTLDRNLLSEENRIMLEIRHEYDRGLPSGAVFLADPDVARKVQVLDSLSSAGLTLTGIGMSFAGLMLIVLMGVLNRAGRNAQFVWMGLSLVFLMAYSIDYLPLSSLPVSYLAFKKIVMSSLFLCIATAGFAIGHIFEKVRLTALTGAATLAVFAAVTAFCRDMIAFKQAYNWMLMLMIPANIAVWLTATIPNLGRSEEARVYSAALLFIGLYAVYTVAVMIRFAVLYNTSPFVFIVIYLCVIFLLHNIEISRKNVLIAQEAQQRSYFYRQSITDSLTGLYMNSYIVRAIEEMEPPCAVAMIDADRFKEINDRYGHPAGDQALIHIADVLRQSVREKDAVGRFGGDEFVALLRDCTPQGAAGCLERFREKLEASPFSIEGEPVRLTVSIGMCHCGRKAASKQIIALADKALYRAKQEGRNKLCAEELGAVAEAAATAQ